MQPFEFGRPAFPPFRKRTDLAGALLREVVLFSSIGFQVVEFPGLPLWCHKFPVTHANGSVSVVTPPQFVMLQGSGSLEHRNQTFSRCLGNGMALPVGKR